MDSTQTGSLDETLRGARAGGAAASPRGRPSEAGGPPPPPAGPSGRAEGRQGWPRGDGHSAAEGRRGIDAKRLVGGASVPAGDPQMRRATARLRGRQAKREGTTQSQGWLVTRSPENRKEKSVCGALRPQKPSLVALIPLYRRRDLPWEGASHVHGRKQFPQGII